MKHEISRLQSELEALDRKAKIQQQEPEQKLKKLENLQFRFQEEHFSVLRRHCPALLLKRLSQLRRFSFYPPGIAIRSSFCTLRSCLLLGYLRGCEGIISYPGTSPIGCLLVRVLRGYSRDIPTNPLHSSAFLARLKTLHYGRVFFGKSI
jgi:hypothetical protein